MLFILISFPECPAIPAFVTVITPFGVGVPLNQKKGFITIRVVSGQFRKDVIIMILCSNSESPKVNTFQNHVTSREHKKCRQYKC